MTFWSPGLDRFDGGGGSGNDECGEWVNWWSRMVELESGRGGE